MSPGTRCVTSTRLGIAVARRRDEVTDVRVHRLGSPFGAELIHEPEADGRTEDDPDDDGVHTLSDERRYRGRRSEKPKQGAADLTRQNRRGACMVGPHGIRSVDRRPLGHLGSAQAAGFGFEQREHTI